MPCYIKNRAVFIQCNIHYTNTCSNDLEVLQLERDWAYFAVKEHCSTSWLGEWLRNHFASPAVVLACFGRGQQDCGNGSTWWWCWDGVVILHHVESFCACWTLICRPLQPLYCFVVILLHAHALPIHASKVVLRI